MSIYTHRMNTPPPPHTQTHTHNTVQYNTTLLPSVNTLIARGMFCGAKYTHHTFTPIIKHLITTANKHPGKKSFIDYYFLFLFLNPTDIQYNTTLLSLCREIHQAVHIT